MHETMAALVLQEHLGAQSFDPPIGPAGDRRTLDPGNAPLRTADGWISVTANTDAQVASFLRAVGRPECLADPAIATLAGRATDLPAWYRFRAQCLAGRSTAAWLDVLRAADVPAMPCHTLETLPHDPHLVAVGLLGTAQHPAEGAIRTIRPTILRDGQAAPPGSPAQPPGWETRAVLDELGLAASEIDALLASGAAYETPA